MIKPVFSITSIICVLALLSGCQSTKPEETTVNYAKITVEEYQQMQEAIAQWQEDKVAIARLLDAEKDLQKLIQALSGYVSNAKPAQVTTTKKQTPLITQANKSQAAVEEVITQNSYQPIKTQAQPVSVDDSIDTNSQKVEYKYAVQLASLNGKTQVLELTSTLEQTLPELIKSKETFSIETVDGKGVTRYRVKWGAFENKAAALDACDKFKQHRRACFVTAFGGEKLSRL
ncbi:SPOR domain-containing protein [Pseudoalteromonas peptidolytica]|uniref:SPOR domain-containing protein n=1 Tax=Pseudoalteromonas peptidolytica F12-50-A1 TaxID=1315280 RepID=A0A8I0T529_9GAMM|nr:SPOR domain-containing protein [Pseudoalteromonas peptidolytica]MBE0346922.1 hypothetical protein [Pseudoalteromonas peptidolytica F12-50-A1]NLR13984.1 hypothetical protein [Pseudoalteromonas peptidolytica]GEK11147.1 hypothetical protein PPE03_33960 [Pseudoalteromonas peptidolytica]